MNIILFQRYSVYSIFILSADEFSIDIHNIQNDSTVMMNICVLLGG